MGLLTALGYALGGRGEARQNANALQLERQKLADEEAAQKSAEALEAQRAKDEAARLAIEQRQSGIDPNTGQPFPFTLQTQVNPNNHGKGAPATDEDTFRLHIKNAQAAYAAGRPDVAANELALANALQLGLYRGAQTQVQKEGVLPKDKAQAALYTAQADYWKQKAPLEKQRLDALLAHYRATDALGYARIAGALQAAKIRASTLAGSEDYKTWIAYQTALNVANHQDQQQAFQSAVVEANAQNRAIAKQNENARLVDPNAPQQSFVTPQQIMQPAGPPVTVYVDARGNQTTTPPANPPGPHNGGHYVVSGDPKVDENVRKLQNVPAEKRAGYVREAVQNGWITEQEAQVILQRLAPPVFDKRRPAGLQPLPINR
jgi:hypothetical protein